MPSKPEVLKARRSNDPEYAERVRGYSKKWRESNIDKAREIDRLKASSSRTKDRDSYNAYMREWRNANKDSINAKNRDRLKNDHEYAERIRALDRKRHKENPLRSRKQNLKQMYGMTLEEYDEKYEAQNGRCSICDEARKKHGHDGLVVDHCHTGSHVRGLLCAKCNTGLGQFKDDVSLLQKAIEYLAKHGKD